MKGLNSKVSSGTDSAKLSRNVLVDGDDIDLSEDESVTEDDAADTTWGKR